MKEIKCARLAAVLFAALFLTSQLQAQPHPTPPKEPRVKPHVSRGYAEDPGGHRITDALSSRIGKVGPIELRAMADVELIFTQQVTQVQIDRFIAMGGEITYLYQSLSYGWNGKLPLGQVHLLPQAMGPSLILVKEALPVRAHLYNATQTGRVRVVWTNFAGNPLGYDGSTNITIGIIDTGVDASHTDLSGRLKYWKDWTGSNYVTGTDNDGHGTHVAGIATGTGAAGGSASGPLYFTQFGNMSGSANGTYTPAYIALPGSVTWRAGAKWTNGTASELEIIDRFYLGGSYQNLVVGSGFGNSVLSASGTISSPGSDVYTAGLVKTNITAYVITNVLTSYPASPDGFNRFRGVAPGCNWAGAKVYDDNANSLDSWVESALDDFVTLRTNYNIKVINLSLGVSGTGIDTALRDKVNNVVQNGIMVVAAAGNDSGSTAIADPGRAAYALTIGAMNGSNTLTSYTSKGFTSPSTTTNYEDYKPDLLAPGGSQYTGFILAPDSNNNDGTGLSDVKANDYTPLEGTSMASPFAAGSAALVIDAMEQNGYTWDFNSADRPMQVKMLLCATATETDQSRENGSYNPTLERATANGSGYPVGKDIYEGYGAINPDAAIEALVLSVTNGVKETNSLGVSLSSGRAWARKISLAAYVPETVSLIVPSTGDFDLYLYSTNVGTFGAPTIIASSTGAGNGVNESIVFNSLTNQQAILVVKRVSGYGSFSLTTSNMPNDNFANAYSLSSASSGYSTGNNTGYTTESGEPSGGGSGKTAWYSWTAPYSGKASFMTTLGVVKVYTGSAVNALTPVTSQFTTSIASNNFLITANTTYHISVDSTGGAYTLSWSYQGVPTLNFTNATVVTLPSSSGPGSPYPLTNYCSGVPGQIVSVSTTIGGVTAPNFTYPKFLLTGPAANVSLKGFMGNGVAVTNLFLTFNGSGTNMDFTTAYSGTFLPTDPLANAVSYDTPAPSTPYSTNLYDFIGTDANGTWSLYVDADGSMGGTGTVTNWLLNIVLASPPSVTIANSTVTYSDPTTATNLTSTCSITDADNWDFSGGSLAVQVTTNAAAEDQFVVSNQGTASGQIGVSGSTISYSGTNFAYFTGGTSGSSPLVVHLTNSAATYAAVEALFTRIAYTNATMSSTSQRTVTLTLNDGLYGTNSVSKQINVVVANHAPTVANAIPNQTATYGVAFSYTVPSNTFTDIDSGQTLSYTASGSILGTASGITFSSATRLFSASTVDSGNGGTIAGSYPVSVIATDNGSPVKSATNTFTLTINKSTATVTPAATSRTYGATNPIFSGTLSGFLAADTISAAYSTTATTNSAPGTYSINATLVDPHGDAGNYTVTTNTGTLTINKAPVTVTANNTSRSYGATNPTFTVSYTGLTNGQTFATSGITGSPTLMTAATTNSSPGTYVITNLVGTLASSDYSFTMANGTLTVTSAVLTVTVSNVTRVYGGSNPSFGVSYSGFTNGQTLASSGVTGTPSLVTGATTNSAVGTYTITNSTGTLSSANYSFNLVNGTLTVTQAVLTVTANNAIRAYGGTNPAFDVSYSGFTNGQSLATSGVTGMPALTTSATTNSMPGAYVITNSVGTLASGNYSFALGNGTLTVTSAVVTVTANPQIRAYGSTNPILTVTYAGFTNGQNLASSGISGSPALTTPANTNSAVGVYTITNSLGSLASANSDYSFNFVNGTLTVTQALLSVTANSFSRTYGVTNPLFSGSLTGGVNGDSISANYTCTATTNSTPAIYPITATLNDAGGKLVNYNVTTNNGTLTVSKAALLVTANDATRAYGSVNPIFTSGYSGFVNGETASSGTIAGAPSLSSAAATNSAVGIYTITNAIGTLASADYAFTLSNGTITVTQASLAITPANASRAYGITNPVFTGTISGIVNNDNISATYSTTATTASPVGTYPISATLSDPGLLLPNYSVATNFGTLTITNASGNNNATVSLLLSNSIIALATNVTLDYTFTDPNSGLAVVVAVTMTPYSTSNASPVFTLLDTFGPNGAPVHLGIDSGLNNGDGNWVDPFEGENFSASLVSASSGIATNSIRFGIAQLGIRPNGGSLTWTSPASTNSFGLSADTLFTLDTNLIALSQVAYSGGLRGINSGGVYQLDDWSTGTFGIGIVFAVSFTEGTNIVGSAASISSVNSVNGQLQFTIRGTAGATYIVQTTTNLAEPNWTPIFTNTSPFTFTDTNAPLYLQRFYRVTTP